MVRTGLEHIFLPGASLWREPDIFTRPAAACSADPLGGTKISSGCSSFLDANEKAKEQWELERRFKEFEVEF
jgi:adenosine deaminase